MNVEDLISKRKGRRLHGLVARSQATTPTRRIRRAQSSIASGLAALDLRDARARLRSKDIALRSVARAGDDAMLAADALRMERDAAHEECARLSVSGVVFRNIARVFEGLYTSTEADLASADTITARLVEVICDQDERLTVLAGVADEADSLAAECARLWEDVDRLTAERDHARAIAVALEQGLVGIVDPIPPYVREVPCWTVICDECHRDTSETTDYSGFGDRWQDATDFFLTEADGAEACGVAICPTCASQKVHCHSCGCEHWGFWGNCIDCWNQATPAPQLARVPMDSDRTPEVEG